MNQSLVWKEKSSPDVLKKTMQDPAKKKILVVAILASIAQIGFFYLFFSPSKDLISVAVATKSLSQGEILEESSVRFKKVVSSEFVEQFISESHFLDLVGSPVSVSVSEGEVITRALIGHSLKSSSVPSKIPPGKRLFVLNLNLAALGALLRAGDHVDIVAASQDSDRTSVRIIMENISLVGVGTSNLSGEDRQDESASSVSFYVTTDEAKELIKLQNKVQFSVILRNPNDISTTDAFGK